MFIYLFSWRTKKNCFFFDRCSYCSATNHHCTSCQLCELIACWECYDDNEWNNIGQKLFCAACDPVAVTNVKKRPLVSKVMSPAKRAKREEKFKQRLSKNLAKIAAEKVRTAKKAAKLVRENNTKPEVLARRKAKSAAREAANHEKYMRENEERRAYYMEHYRSNDLYS